jgi:hypothetical protein
VDVLVEEDLEAADETAAEDHLGAATTGAAGEAGNTKS